MSLMICTPLYFTSPYKHWCRHIHRWTELVPLNHPRRLRAVPDPHVLLAPSYDFSKRIQSSKTFVLFCFVFFSILVLFSSSPPSSGGSCTSRSGRRSRLLPGAKITIMVCCWCWCWPRVFTEEIPKCPKNKFPHFVAGKMVIPTWTWYIQIWHP